MPRQCIVKRLMMNLCDRLSFGDGLYYFIIFISIVIFLCVTSGSQVVSWEDNTDSGRAAALPSRNRPVLGEREHQLPRGLHPVCELRRQGGALPHRVPQRQVIYRRGGVLWEPHAAGRGETWHEALCYMQKQVFSGVCSGAISSVTLLYKWCTFRSPRHCTAA